MKNKKGILTIDIGNTSIHFGLFQKGKLVKESRMLTALLKRKGLSGILSSFKLKEKPVVVCSSVVPHIDGLFSKIVQKELKAKTLFCGRQVKVPIKNLYKHPRSVGQDRLVNAFAAKNMFKAPIVIVDCGTAVTFDAVDKKGDYLGGLILPGLSLSLRALNEHTALLPLIDFRKGALRDKLIGRTTQESMRSGLLRGYRIMIPGLCQQLKGQLGNTTKVVLTGGESNLIYPFFSKSFRTFYQPGLTLQGLYLLAFHQSL